MFLSMDKYRFHTHPRRDDYRSQYRGYMNWSFLVPTLLSDFFKDFSGVELPDDRFRPLLSHVVDVFATHRVNPNPLH